MNPNFFKFPSTPHLTVLGTGSVRDDKVFSQQERDAFLKHEVIVEEKIDGANLGISFDGSGAVHVQNRGDFLSKPYPGQWKKLESWLESNLNFLFDVLHDQYILFGEWCFARHSVEYDDLPSWFLGFDIYDRASGHFLSCAMRNHLLMQMRICRTPLLGRGRFTFQDLQLFFKPSCFGKKPSEGIYLRHDQDEWLAARAKLVRPEFVQAIDVHWSRAGITPNKLNKNVFC